METIKAENLEQARREIDKKFRNKEKIIVLGKDIEFNRKILENKKVNMLILNHMNKKDKLKQRDSGLNEILCKIARDNNIALAIDFRELKQENKKEKAKILGRIIQNIKLIKKIKNKLVAINSPDKSTPSLLRVLGADTKLAEKAII